MTGNRAHSFVLACVESGISNKNKTLMSHATRGAAALQADTKDKFTVGLGS